MAQIKEYQAHKHMCNTNKNQTFMIKLIEFWANTLWWSLWHDNEAISESDDDDKPWRIKRRSPPPQKTQLLSVQNQLQIWTQVPQQAHWRWKKVFSNKPGWRKPTEKGETMFVPSQLQEEMKECHYAHGEEDAWCLSCRDMCGHYTQNCPQLKKSQDDD